ncbi:Inactive purple acid phosphatase [Actinidia chinensis var. chinensis]|uniref:Inactive purple acid phosphatase n=1 Tax=Actinidia chinensis var. chinensis TaxID=1590841 RepID=A0A2R6PBS2_ACTCC|nr:Inactive purple acid phosphatase [Actinidia chinensis var. chinensis]
MYTTSHVNRDAPFRERMLEHLEPLFVKNNVTLALWGHVRRHERFCPLNNFTCGEAFLVHVVIGMAGQYWEPIWEPRPEHTDVPIFPQPSWSLYQGGEFGYTRLVATKEKLLFSYMGNHNGEVHDEVEILASGQVLNGDSGNRAAAGSKMVQSIFPWYVKGASVLLLGAFVGYVVGYILHARRDAASRQNWTPVKNEVI